MLVLDGLQKVRRELPRLRLRHAAAVLPPPRADAQKKTGHATEQDRPDILTQREAWFDGQIDLAPERLVWRLVFIDETWAKTNMGRTHGRAPRGRRLRMGFPHGHWCPQGTRSVKTTTFVGALTVRGMIAPFVLTGAINRDAFEAYVETVLVPSAPATS